MRSLIIQRCLILPVIVFLVQGCAGMYFRKADQPPPSRRYLSPAECPVKEYWTGIVFNGTRIGFSHFKISPAEEEKNRFDIHSEAYFRTRLLWLDKKIKLKSHDQVAEDLTLIRFDHRFDMDGNLLYISGKQADGKLEVTIESRDQTRHQTIVLAEKIYPTSAIGLYPLMHGLEVGRRYSYPVYDGQTQKIGTVVQEITAYEESDLYRGQAFKINTRLLGHKVTTWMDLQGQPLLEMSLGGVIISAVESKTEAQKYLTTAALNKDETLLNFSLIKSDTKIVNPPNLHSMSVSITGIQPSFSLPTDRRQYCERTGKKVICEISSNPLTPAEQWPAEDQDVLQRYLLPTYAISAEHPKIKALAADATTLSKNSLQRARSLIDWIQANIKQQPVDVFTALDVLEGGKAECQGHALLYAAFARTLKLPTRVVNGIVYSPEFQGFLYHTWNESYLDGAWVAVDPTFGQLPADATHLKLVEGHTLSDLLPLLELIGRIDVRIIDLDGLSK